MNVCQEAEHVVSGEKRREYGPVSDSLRRTALIWSGVLNIDVKPEQVALCLAGLKLAREAHLHKRDNLVDICGYARVLELYREEQAGQPCCPPTKSPPNIVMWDGQGNRVGPVEVETHSFGPSGEDTK